MASLIPSTEREGVDAAADLQSRGTEQTERTRRQRGRQAGGEQKKRTSCFAPRLFRSCAESRPEPVPYNIANRKMGSGPTAESPSRRKHCRRSEDDSQLCPEQSHRLCCTGRREHSAPAVQIIGQRFHFFSVAQCLQDARHQRTEEIGRCKKNAVPAGLEWLPPWSFLRRKLRQRLGDRRHGFFFCQRLARCIFRQRRYKRRCICFRFLIDPHRAFFPPAFVVYGRCSVD